MSVRFEMIKMSDVTAGLAKLPAEFRRALLCSSVDPTYMRWEIERLLAAKQDDDMLGEALTLAINNGNNLDRLRQKLAHNAKQLARVNDIIETLGLKSTAVNKLLPTLSRLLISFPVEAFKLAHEIRPKLRYGSQTSEAFPYAMRQNGFGALILKDMHQLYEAYCLYKAQNSGEPVNSDLLRNMRYYVTRAQDGRKVVGESETRELIKEPKYGIFTKDGELVEVLKQMAAEYRTIASVD